MMSISDIGIGYFKGKPFGQSIQGCGIVDYPKNMPDPIVGDKIVFRVMTGFTVFYRLMNPLVSGISQEYITSLFLRCLNMIYPVEFLFWTGKFMLFYGVVFIIGQRADAYKAGLAL